MQLYLRFPCCGGHVSLGVYLQLYWAQEREVKLEDVKVKTSQTQYWLTQLVVEFGNSSSWLRQLFTVISVEEVAGQIHRKEKPPGALMETPSPA